MKNWLAAFRLRTLPLALASIGMGAFLAAASGAFNALVFGLCALTTILLQVLSNLANDYGDSIHGADSVEREGPSRAVQSGVISQKAMKQAYYHFCAPVIGQRDRLDLCRFWMADIQFFVVFRNRCTGYYCSDYVHSRS